MLKKLSIEGYIIILVSHKLDEVFELCKEATILKNGSKIKTIPIPFERKKIVDLMFKGDKKRKTAYWLKLVQKRDSKNTWR